jgi:phage-related minor tail protein
VSVNTHNEFALEILMTMAPLFDEGVPILSFCLEGVEEVVPYEYIKELLGFQKGASEQVDVHGGTLDDFWSMIIAIAHQ